MVSPWIHIPKARGIIYMALSKYWDMKLHQIYVLTCELHQQTVNTHSSAMLIYKNGM